MSTVLTLAAPAEYREEIRKSRFVARAAPVDSAQAALDWIAAVAEAGASHNCWAYRVGTASRMHDDGEPGGTAGRPILLAIEGGGFDRVAVVVTRWYGGIKLGTGGLARAYGGCAAACLRLAPAQPWVALRAGTLACGFASLPVVKSRLATLGGRLEHEQYDADGVRARLVLPAGLEGEAARALADATRGRGQLDWDDGPA